MIVTSKINLEKYFWVKVPRTATYSYEKLFFPEFYNNKTKLIHLHSPYFLLNTAPCEDKPVVVGGFTVVRHPYSRFISALKYLKRKRKDVNVLNNISTFLSVCEFCGKENVLTKEDFYTTLDTNFLDFLENESMFYDFVYSYFDRNCMLKPGYSWENILQTENASRVHTMFNTQTYFAYHPKVKIFKYENLQEFNGWIENTLGVSTSNLTKDNSSDNMSLNIDVTTKKFKDLVKYLFHDDFKLFGYDI
jgi:hypothetical protein